MLESIAARLKQGQKAVENIVKFYNTLQLDVDRIALVFEPLLLNFESLRESSSLDSSPGWFLKKCLRGMLRGLTFLHDEMQIVFAGEYTDVTTGTGTERDIIVQGWRHSISPFGCLICNPPPNSQLLLIGTTSLRYQREIRGCAYLLHSASTKKSPWFLMASVDVSSIYCTIQR